MTKDHISHLPYVPKDSNDDADIKKFIIVLGCAFVDTVNEQHAYGCETLHHTKPQHCNMKEVRDD
jgi:hypothetical protein